MPKSLLLAYAVARNNGLLDNRLQEAVDELLEEQSASNPPLRFLLRCLLDEDGQEDDKNNADPRPKSKRQMLKNMLLNMPVDAVESFAEKLQDEWPRIATEANPWEAMLRILQQHESMTRKAVIMPNGLDNHAGRSYTF